MFCSHCGKQLDPSSRFCPACGAAIDTASPFAFAQPVGQLARPRENRMIAGVCAGFALHYGWDVNLVRIITALIIVLTGVGAIAYIAAWVIIPEAPYALPAKST
jgi:phage shock protein C